MIDVWNVKPGAGGRLSTFLAHSTLDRATVEAIASGRKPFPNYSDIPLTPQRRLLHEVIVQAVTERHLSSGSPDAPPNVLLGEIVQKIVHSPVYRQMAAHSEVNAVNVSLLLDEAGLERLPNVPSRDRTTLIMATGGPATGKSDLVATLAKRHPEIYRNAAIVNSDDYKPLLADPKDYGDAYAEAAHDESAYLSDEILNRLGRKMDAGRAPNAVLDVVTISEQRMAFAKKSSHLIVATSAAPPEVSLQWSHKRGEETGRVVRSEAVLAGAKAASATAPRVFEHPHAEIELFDTNVPIGSKHMLVARGDSHMLAIREPDAFLNFVEQQRFNLHAKDLSQLLTSQAQTPSALASGLRAYTDRGVTLAFFDPHGDLAISVSRDGVDQIRPLHSARGASFFTELVAASKIAIEAGAHSVTPERRTTRGTEPPLSNESAYHVRGNALAAGAGVALSAKGIYDDVAGHDSRLKRDVHAGGVQAAAGEARFGTQVADLVISAAATADGIHHALNKAAPVVASTVAKGEGFAMRLAGSAAIPLAVGAGVLEATAGVAEHNAKRVAAAIGGTAGGLWGGVRVGARVGALLGAEGGVEMGPGAILTAGAGALGGAIVGGFLGEKAAELCLTGTIDKAMDLFNHHTGHPAPATPKPAAPNHSPDMLRALAAAKQMNLAHGIHHAAHHEHLVQPPAPALPASRSQSTQDR